MESTLKKVFLDQGYLKPGECLTTYDKLNDHAYIFAINKQQLYVVCDQKGANDILKEYREASIEAARKDIPEVYHKFFTFTLFACYTWQSLEDVYDSVYSTVIDDKTYYICSV